MSVIVFLRIEIPYIEEMHRLDKDKQICPPGSDCQSAVFLSGNDKDNEHKTYLKGRSVLEYQELGRLEGTQIQY